MTDATSELNQNASDAGGRTLQTSAQSVSLYLKSISLDHSFGGLVEHITHAAKHIYFVAINWDYSGAKPMMYPQAETATNLVANTLKPGDSTNFIGDGIELYPSSKITGGLNIAIFVFESESGLRNAGNFLQQIAGKIQSSTLCSELEKLAGNLLPANAQVIEKAATALYGDVSQLLESISDKQLASFQGSYGVENLQTGKATQSFSQNGVSISIELETV